MRDTIIIGVACVIAIAAGMWLFFSGNEGVLAPATSRGPVAYTTLAEGSYSGSVTERANYRIKNTEELVELWKMMYGTDGPTLPAIDFGKHEVLAIFDGTHSSGGYDVRIASIEDEELTRRVTIVRVTPGDDCMTTTAITSPYLLVAAPKSVLPLSREEVSEVAECN
jgi:hypothetical protein